MAHRCAAFHGGGASRSGRAEAQPARPGGAGGADTLAGFAGEGAARLLVAAPEEGALLLERLSPSTPLQLLAEQDDDAATLAAARVMLALRRPSPAGALLGEAGGWVRLLDRAMAEAWPLPRPTLDRAAGLFRDLAADAPSPVLLHGDLHHDNILKDGASWRAIDPRGLAGNPAFEAAALLHNPPGSPLAPHAPRRIAILAEATGLDRWRIAGWGYTAVMLAAAWAVEGGKDTAPWSSTAEVLAACPA